MEVVSKNNVRAWLNVLGCGTLVAGTVTFYTVVIGDFFVPAAESLGVDNSSISLYSTLLYLGIACGLPFVGNCIHRIPPIGIAVFAAIQSLVIFALSFSQSVIWWWIGGFIVGIGMAFTSIVFISSVLTNWFVKKTGFAIGLAWSIASAVAAIMSPITVSMTEALGWRLSLMIFSLVGATLAVPSALFLVSHRPELKGLKPYGYEELSEEAEAKIETGIPTKQAVFSRAFFLIALALALTQIVSVINAYFPMYAKSVNFDPSVGALMISVALMVDIFLNPIVGMTIDRIGAIKGFVVWSFVGILSMIILMFSAGNPLIAYLGAGLEDTMYVLLGVGIASVTSTVFGPKNYAKIFAYLTVFGLATGSAGGYIIATLYQKTGSFNAVFIFCMIAITVISLSVIGAGRDGKRMAQKMEEEEEGSPEECAIPRLRLALFR